MIASTRTRKTMIATALGEDVEYQTAGDYTVAGVLMYPDAENHFPRRVVAVGTSWASVERRTRTISRKIRPNLHKCDEHHVMEIVRLVEATAPVLREYFGRHSLAITSVFTEAAGWQDARYSAGRSTLRKLAKEGVQAVMVSMPRGRNLGRREADFRMSELLASMNKRTA